VRFFRPTRLVAGGLFLAAILGLFRPAAADDFEKALEAARAGLRAKDPAAALGGLKKAVAAAWKNLPFTAINVHLLAAPPADYGRFLPRVDNVYRPSEPLIIYLEPVGFTVKNDPAQGLYNFHLTADFNMVDAWGRVVAGRRGFGQFSEESRQFPDHFFLTFTYSIAGLPPGEYRVETVLHDKLGKKSHIVVTPIRIESP